MAITSTESFLALLEKSQLLSAKDLEKVRAVAGKYEDAKALAKAIVAAKGLTRWQAGQLLAGRSSFSLGKYKLVDLLGRGGMGSVFAAEHKTLGRRVALKIISKQTGRDPEQLERFLEEARRIAALDHPNIVRAFDVDHEGERYFLVLERIEGRDLRQIVETDGPLDVARAVKYIRQAALGLAHAHQRKMIHCDIKPGNLIVGDDDVVKILDMGMARLVESDGSSSDSNENVVGTIDYIAPEQALDAEDLDHRVDIYSLGCTLYFLLTSRPPFGEGTLAQRIMKHQTQEPRPISETRSGVPDALVKICSKMMAKKPEDRYQSAADVAEALEQLSRAGKPTVPEKPGGSKAASVKLDDDGGPPVVELIGDDDASVELDDGEVSISVVDSGSIAARGGSSRGRRSATERSEEKTDEEAGASAGFFSDPRKKWGVIIGAAVLLLGGVAGSLAFMMGGGPKQTASADADNGAVDEASQATSSAPSAPANDAALDSMEDLSGLDAAFGSGDGKEQGGESDPPVADPPGDVTMPPAADDAGKSAVDPKADTSEKASKETPPAKADGGDAKKPESPKPAKKKDDEKADEKKEPGKKPAAEKKKEPEKKPPKVEPFKGFPSAFNIPELSDNDAFGAASKAPVVLATIRGPSTVNWQMLLVGGDKVLKGGRKFVLARTESDAAKAAWSIQVEGSSTGEGQDQVARIWREKEFLNFQWAEKASGAVANYLRSCIVQVRVGGESRYAQMSPPITADPIVLDLIRGQSNGSVEMKWAPDGELLRVKFLGVEGGEKAVFDPAEPVPPKTQVALHFVYTDKYQNDTNAVTFQLLPTSRRSSLNMTVRLMNPQPREFQSQFGNMNEQELGVAMDRLGNKRTELERKLGNLKGEEAQKTTRTIDALSLQMWFCDFFIKTHKKATLQYQVVADLGGQEFVLATTK